MISPSPDNVRGRVLLAKVALRLNQCDKVIYALEPVVARHENDAESLYMLSRAYRCAGKEELADQTLTEYKRLVSRKNTPVHSSHPGWPSRQKRARSSHLDAALDLICRKPSPGPRKTATP